MKDYKRILNTKEVFVSENVLCEIFKMKEIIHFRKTITDN